MYTPFKRTLTPTTYGSGFVFVFVDWDGKRLSLTGVEAPYANGNCSGSFGQITLDPSLPQKAWTTEKVERLAAIWDRWHLNDMRAGSEAQEAWLREHRAEYEAQTLDHYVWAKAELAKAGLQPDNGYSYGSSWMTEEVPLEVLAELHSMPAASLTPPGPWAHGR